MLESVREFKYNKLSPEEMQSRHILGRLVGVIADFKHPTRNDRLYCEELWDKTFDNPIMLEKLENRCILGELGHPTDRTETDIEKVAICLAELPKKLPNGTVHGVFDILDTPNGRLLNTLCQYGCNIGVSSRGTGDVYEDFNGQESVAPDTYDCECWDAVLLPAVKSARPVYVTESLNGKSLKQCLTESLSEATDTDKKIMEATLNTLNIDYSSDKDDNINETEDAEPIQTANNVGAELISNLQESLLREQALQATITELQEKLSVCYTKESNLEEQLNKYKQNVIALSDSAKEVKTLKTENEKLVNESLTKDATINKLNSRISSLIEQQKTNESNNKTLTESISRYKEDLTKSSDIVAKLEESYNDQLNIAKQRENQLTESIAELRKNSAIKQNEYNSKLIKANKLIEQYKAIAVKALDKYIESKAINLGVNVTDIKNRLSENYSFNQIDQVCESLRDYKLNINSLPFNISRTIQPKISITESKKEHIKPKTNVDDDIDDMLANMVGLD